MIGTTVRSKPSFPVGTLLCLVPAGGLFALAAAMPSIHPAIVGFAFLVLALFLFLARPAPVVLTFTEDGIDVEQPQQFIPYSTIHTLRPFGRSHNFNIEGKDHFALNIVHQNGVLYLPRTLNVSSEDVLQFLDSRLPERAGEGLPKALARHAEEQADLFGDNKVWGYSARDHLGFRSAYPYLRTYLGYVLACAVPFVTGCVLLSAPDRTSHEIGGIYLGAGFMTWLFGSLIWLIIWSVQRGPIRAVRNWQHSGLVISPAGLALIQGDLKGELAWEEIREVKLDPRQRFGILLRVEGANIFVADIYRTPLSHLLEKIRDNWRGDRGD
jgi:hypothetical protein